jgi:cytoskeletal protein RodZ
MRSTTSPDPGSYVGNHRQAVLCLAARRSQAGITLEQVATRTKISPASLRAIENEEFHLLPGGIFTTSYLRQYAEAVGVDPEELLEAARRSLSAREAPEAGESPSGVASRGFWRAAAALLRHF